MIDPQEIDRKQFDVKFRGYDPDEVDDFLDQVLASYREMEQRMTTALAKLTKLRDSTSTQVIPTAIGDTARLLNVAQMTADQTVAEANGEAGEIVVRARKEADEIVNAGHERRHQVIAQLESQREALQEHVGALQKAMAAARHTMKSTLDALGEGPAHV